MRRCENILEGVPGPKWEMMIVHPGVFHADDVLSAILARLCVPNLPVERRVPAEDELQDPKVLVADIGGEFSPWCRSNFDHHQVGRKERPDGTPYAACGLLWDFEAKEHILRSDRGTWSHSLISEWLKGVDAYDNGVPGAERPPVAEMVSAFLPAYGEEADFGSAFERAVEAVQPLVERKLAHARANAIARGDLAGKIRQSRGERILVLEEFIPFQEHWDLIDDELQFIVYPSPRGGWVARTVPTEAWGRSPRTALPKEWWGLRGAELAIRFAPDGELEEVPAEGWFCHPNGFICGAPTREEAVKMAERAVALDPAIRKERDEAVKSASDRMR